MEALERFLGLGDEIGHPQVGLSTIRLKRERDSVKLALLKGKQARRSDRQRILSFDS